MAKFIKRKKKKSFRLATFTVSFALFSAFAYLCSALFLRSYNNSLSTQAQAISSQIAAIQTQNDAITVEIQTLSTSERVNSIASDEGLSLDQNNIITITPTSGNSESE